MEAIKFNVEVSVKREEIFDLLVCAFEGGSNYWYLELEPLKETSDKKIASDRFYDNLITNGFSLKDNTDGAVHKVRPNAFAEALKIMHEKFSNHFQDLKDENTDACTGDVFLQLLVFKDVIYG